MHIPKWSTRRGKIFYIRLSFLALGIIMVCIAWMNRDSVIMVEIAATFMGVAIGSMINDAMLFFVPCKKLKKEVYE